MRRGGGVSTRVPLALEGMNGAKGGVSTSSSRLTLVYSSTHTHYRHSTRATILYMCGLFPSLSLNFIYNFYFYFEFLYNYIVQDATNRDGACAAESYTDGSESERE